MSRCAVLLVAAGTGVRFGGPVAKQYRLLGGRAVLWRTARTFLSHPAVGSVRAVIGPGQDDAYRHATAGLALEPPVEGGATRQESVRRGLEALRAENPRLVLIHDAVRPLIDADTIGRVCAALDRGPAAIAAVAVIDTLKRSAAGENTSAGTVDRAGLWRAQTPQGFRYGEILEAHRAAAGADLTDDAAVAERYGLPVALVPGNEDNFKVTTEQDLDRAERLLRADGGETRVGSGFDVHRFGPGDHVMLCGVAVPHDRALVGHSDADVGLHALTDALLGALGAGDIGQHFPPSDPRWRGADSARFLRHAASLVAERGGRIVHVDLTLICETPKLTHHRAAMTTRIASLLGVADHRVGLKATTTEGLGFAGRGEGIAAQATATVRLPFGQE
ncbi:MAG: bifunctional 2-C-methyl-D-erythritol 4-phosphate cytidylyltransferase/2-C-methyl-D-erythritol 2,4-cyclodiphosphate synthase [Inquilinaceae bacterium]